MIRLVKRNDLTNKARVIGLFADDKAVLEYMGPGFEIYDKVYKNNTRYTHAHNNVTYILYDNSVKDEYQIEEPDKTEGFVIVGLIGAVLGAFLFGYLGAAVAVISVVLTALIDGTTIERKADKLPDDHETVGMMKGARL